MTLTQRLTEILEKYLILHNKDCKECKIEIKYALSAILTAIRTDVEGLKKDMGYTGDSIGDIIKDVRNEYGGGYNSAISDVLEKLK
jgi:hypothetical protein